MHWGHNGQRCSDLMLQIVDSTRQRNEPITLEVRNACLCVVHVIL